MSCELHVEEDGTYVLEWATHDIEEIVHTCSPNRIIKLKIQSYLDNYQFSLKLLSCDCFSNVTELKIYHSSVQGIKALVDSSLARQLTELDLYSNNIDEVGASTLAHSANLTQLTMLHLGRNKIGELGGKALAQSSNLKQLTSLDLGYNSIGGAGAAALAQSANLKRLTRLDISNNNIGDAGAMALAQSSNLKQLTSFDLGRNKIGEVGGKALAQSSNLKQLTSLDLQFNNIGDGGAAALAHSVNLTPLTMLHLGGNRIGEVGLTALAQSVNLTHLTTLNLSYNNIGHAGAATLAQSSNLKQLTSLDLGYNNIGDVGATALAQSSNLTHLTMLDLSSNNIGEVGATALAQSSNLKHLTKLDLSNNNIGEVGATALAHSENLKHLTRLDLINNNIGDAGATALAQSSNLNQLTMLGLGDNNIGGVGATALAQSSNLNQLTMLGLGDNNIGGVGATALAQSSNLTHLTMLHLWSNNIGDAGATALAQSSNLTHLTMLHLWSNNIGDAGATALAQSSNLKELTKLDLQYNNIGDAGVSAIIFAKRLKKLMFLSLVGNSLITASVVCDMQALREYYIQRDALQTIPIKAIKTFLIGEPNAGKSTLLRALTGQKLELGRLARTQGFEKGQIQINNLHHEQFGDKVDITLNLWDMGGQTIQKMIHPLFFRPRALYLYVANSVHQAQAGKHWLDNIVEGIQSVWLMSVANPHQVIDAPELNKALRTLQNSFVDKCNSMGVKQLYICSDKDKGDTSGIVDSLGLELASFPLPVYLEPYIKIAEQFVLPPKPFYRQTEFCDFLEQQSYIKTIWQDVKQKLAVQGKSITEDGFYHNLVYYLDDLGVVAYLPEQKQKKRPSDTFETVPDGWVITDPVYIQKGLYALLPPEGESLADTDNSQMLLKKLQMEDESTGLVGIFNQEDLLPIIDRWFQNSNQDKPPNASRVCKDLIEILSHRQLNVVMKLESNRYLVPAYIENNTAPSAAEQNTRLLDAYQHSHLAFVFKKSTNWPKYFLARFAVFLTNEQQYHHRFTINPQAITYKHITIEAENKALTIELFQYGKQIWWLGKAKDESQMYLIPQTMGALFDLIKVQLMMLNDYKVADLQRVIPCPKCMGNYSSQKENNLEPKNLENIGLYNYDNLLLDNDNTIFTCQPPQNFASHRLDKKVIMSAINIDFQCLAGNGLVYNNKSDDNSLGFNIDPLCLSEIDKRIIKGNFDEKKDQDDITLACHFALSRIFKLLLDKEFKIVVKDTESSEDLKKKIRYIKDKSAEFKNDQNNKTKKLYSRKAATVLGVGKGVFKRYRDEINVMLVKLIGIDRYPADRAMTDIDNKLMIKQIVHLRHFIEDKGMSETAELIKSALHK